MKKILFTLLLALFVFRCTTDRSLPNGFEALQRTNKGSIQVKEIRANRCGRFWTTPSTGLQSTLMLGSYKDLQSHAIIKFYSITGIDTGSVVSATLQLTMTHIYGTGSSIQAQIYPITTDWTNTEVQWKDIENNFNTEQSMGTLNIVWADSVPDSGMVVEASIKPELVNSWISSSTDNRGIILFTQQSDFMAEFYSVDALKDLVTLTVVHQNSEGTNDTTVIYKYIRDASLLLNSNQEPMEQLSADPNSLIVGDASGFQSLIQFDLSGVPEQITLHQAFLTLHVQGDKSDARDFGIPMEFAMISNDSSWDIAQLAVDSTLATPVTVALATADSAVLSTFENIYYFTTIVNKWLSDGSKNQGLLMQSVYQGAFISDIWFYSTKADSEFIPTLRLTYSEPPVGRFEKP